MLWIKPARSNYSGGEKSCEGQCVGFGENKRALTDVANRNARFLRYFVHIQKHDGDNLEHFIVEGKVENSGPRGKSLIHWLTKL